MESPRPQGNTGKMVNAFAEAAGNHKVDVVDVYKKNIRGCLACEHCHTTANGVCVQKDDMQEVIAMFLGSGDNHMYDGARFSYERDFVGYLGLKIMGIFMNHDFDVMKKIKAMAKNRLRNEMIK